MYGHSDLSLGQGKGWNERADSKLAKEGKTNRGEKRDRRRSRKCNFVSSSPLSHPLHLKHSSHALVALALAKGGGREAASGLFSPLLEYTHKEAERRRKGVCEKNVRCGKDKHAAGASLFSTTLFLLLLLPATLGQIEGGVGGVSHNSRLSSSFLRGVQRGMGEGGRLCDIWGGGEGRKKEERRRGQKNCRSVFAVSSFSRRTSNGSADWELEKQKEVNPWRI